MIPVAKSILKIMEIEIVARVHISEMLPRVKIVKEFETIFSKFDGTKRCEIREKL
jgi:hypothetical protein